MQSERSRAGSVRALLLEAEVADDADRDRLLAAIKREGDASCLKMKSSSPLLTVG